MKRDGIARQVHFMTHLGEPLDIFSELSKSIRGWIPCSGVLASSNDRGGERCQVIARRFGILAWGTLAC